VTTQIAEEEITPHIKPMQTRLADQPLEGIGTMHVQPIRQSDPFPSLTKKTQSAVHVHVHIQIHFHLSVQAGTTFGKNCYAFVM
jgi:hypothetical protein